MNQQPPWQPQEPPYGQQSFGGQQWQQQAPPSQPSVYNRPTQAAPRPFKRPRLTTFPPPQRPSGIWQWYTSRTRSVQISLGCGAALAVLLFFACIGAAVASVQLATPSPPTPTTPSQQAALLVSPTVTDSPTPTPSPTLTPTPTPKPALAPTQAPQPTPLPPTPTPCPGVNCNPWGYNFIPGHYIYSPPSAFCTYFHCIVNFFKGHGYVVECKDSEYSKSGGLKGACSYHGGVLRPLYSH
jgi:hypothetical protein